MYTQETCMICKKTYRTNFFYRYLKRERRDRVKTMNWIFFIYNSPTDMLALLFYNCILISLLFKCVHTLLRFLKRK